MISLAGTAMFTLVMQQISNFMGVVQEQYFGDNFKLSYVCDADTLSLTCADGNGIPDSLSLPTGALTASNSVIRNLLGPIVVNVDIDISPMAEELKKMGHTGIGDGLPSLNLPDSDEAKKEYWGIVTQLRYTLRDCEVTCTLAISLKDTDTTLFYEISGDLLCGPTKDHVV